MFNPMAMAQIMSQLQQSNNPMGMMQNIFGQNPLMQRAMMMSQGKSPQEMQQIVRNLARQKGMSDEQLNQMLGQFGLRL